MSLVAVSLVFAKGIHHRCIIVHGDAQFGVVVSLNIFERILVFGQFVSAGSKVCLEKRLENVIELGNDFSIGQVIFAIVRVILFAYPNDFL